VSCCLALTPRDGTCVSQGRLQLPPNTFALPTLPSPTGAAPPGRQGTSQPDGPDRSDDWMLGPNNLNMPAKRAAPAEMFSDEDEDVEVVLMKHSEDDEDYVPVVAKPRSRKGGNRGRKPRGRPARTNSEATA